MKTYKDHLVAYIDFLGFQDFIKDKSPKEIEKIIPLIKLKKLQKNHFK